MSTTVITEAAPAGTEVKCECKLGEAHGLIKKYTYWSLGAGALPLGVLDLAAIAAVQTKLVNDLSNLYGVKFCQHRAKNITAILIASVGAGTLLRGVTASVVKMIPLIGTFSGMVALPIVAGAATYALGKVFVQHFEMGGTLLDFDPEKTREYFAAQFKEGQKVAADLKAAH